MAFLVLGIGTLTACSSTDPSVEDDHVVRMPIVLAIPANNAELTTGSAGAKATRAEGDPGTYEKFELPKYLYIYLINTSINGTDKVVLTPEGMNLQSGYTLKADKWTKTITTDNKDSIYTYTDQIRIIIPENRSEGVVYAAMSTVPIAVTYTGTGVEDATFTLGDDVKDKSEALKNLYSSPYNLNNSNGYYGIVNDYKSNSPYINMVLYHVASKLDVQWNVDAKVQDKVKLSKITLTGLSRGGKLFKPLENTESSSTYDETFTLDAGNQWYGRKATYVIPVQTDGKYQFPMTLTNSLSSEENKDRSTTAKAEPSTSSAIFVPWIYGTVKVTKW
ncbi:hypothetical protein [Hallella mizrahii]|uniref:Fimbrillin family protein n=1 Tax=Hallella mizrahii TaxID=2606637 RepID=A0A7K0KDL9_9BACT|nr:hypothetical protein [Hallella mizrahii]MST83948.1 hypothetical protein [Hallella mizrahii]